MKIAIKLFWAGVLGLAFSVTGFCQTHEEIMAKRQFWPPQIAVTEAFESPLAEASGRKTTASFRVGQRLSFQGPYQKKPGFLLVKNGTSFALAPVGSTDLFEQMTKNERLGRRTAVATAAGAPPKAKALLEMKVVKGTGQKGSAFGGDNKSQNVVMKTTIKSREFKRGYKGVQAKIYVLGKAAAANVKNRAYQMIAYKEHTFDLLPGKTIEFESPPVALNYDSRNSIRYGTKFYGYLLEVYEDGQLIAQQSSPSTLVKYADSVRSQTVAGRYSSTYFELK